MEPEKDMINIDISNIAKAISAKTLEVAIGDLSKTPPFPKFAISWINESIYGLCIVSSFDQNDGPAGLLFNEKDLIFDADGKPTNLDMGTNEDARWLVQLDLFAGRQKARMENFGSYSFWLDELGMDIGKTFIECGGNDNEDFDKDWTIGLAWFPMSAIALMNVKNISLVDRPVSRQVRRKHERKGIPLPQYKILELTPLKPKTKNKSDVIEKGEPLRALHIARGHFRTYTDAAPLFGRITGTFWIPAHMRGNKDNGEVIKDYQLSGATRRNDE